MTNEEKAYIMKKLDDLDERIRTVEINYAHLTGKIIVVVTLGGFAAHFLVSFLSKLIGT